MIYIILPLARYFGQSEDCTQNFLELYDIQGQNRQRLVSRYCQNVSYQMIHLPVVFIYK